MLSKKQRMITPARNKRSLQRVFMKDFSEALSVQMIKYYCSEHYLKMSSIHNSDKTALINSIVSDYQAIKPIGNVSVKKLKKELRLAIK